MKNIDNKTGADVQRMFDDLAGHYDLVNRLLSLGTDIHWRRKAVEFCEPAEGMSILDMCCGTGDLAIAFAEQLRGNAEIVGCDFSREMITIAEQKAARLDLVGRADEGSLEWLVGDCQDTGLDEGRFDVISCGFGVRNIADREKGLREMHRLLKPGGRTCIVEFALPSNAFVRAVCMLYLSVALPIVGGLFSGRFRAYRYLSRTIRKWGREVDLTEELRQAGFSRVDVHSLGVGMVAVHVAHR